MVNIPTDGLYGVSVAHLVIHVSGHSTKATEIGIHVRQTWVQLTCLKCFQMKHLGCSDP